MSLTIKHWSEEQFAASREAWTGLIGRSSVDRLFLGWEWQYTWWSSFARPLGLELLLLAAYDRDGMLVGLAPLYRKVFRVRGFLRLARIQFIGNCWRSTGTVRTEHMDFIAERRVHLQVVDAFMRHLEEIGRWDEFVIVDMRTDTPTFAALSDGAAGRCHVRQAESDASYYVATDGDFDAYLAQLGQTTRARLYKRRSHLSGHGQVEVTNVGDSAEFLAILNQVHQVRWGVPAFDERRMQFKLQLAERLKGQRNFSVLSVGGRPVSAMCNFRIGEDEYYLRGGFDDQFDRKLSPGLLHLGYTIEQAFADPHIRRFNMLAGNGKNTPYKTHLTALYYPVGDIQMVRPALLRLAYRLYDRAARERSARTAAPQAVSQAPSRP